MAATAEAPQSAIRVSPGTGPGWPGPLAGRGQEVYAADADGGDAARLTFWGDRQTRVTGWTAGGEMLAVTAAGQPAVKYRRAFAVPGLRRRPAPPLPFGPVNDLALEAEGTALLTGSVATSPRTGSGTAAAG